MNIHEIKNNVLLPVSPAPAVPNTDPMIASPAVVPTNPRLVPKNA